MFALFIYLYLMSELDVISVQEAKRWLELDYEDEGTDQDVAGLIKAAIAWIEQYTSYRLYQRDVVIQNSRCEQSIGLFPITVSSVKNQQNATVEYKATVLPTKLRIRCPYNSVITLTVGYSNPADIPQPLIEAAKKWIVYMWENRDIYSAQIPADVHILINQFRRALA